MAKVVFITANIWTATEVETVVDQIETKIVVTAQSMNSFSTSPRMIDSVVITSIKK